jgi:hypothetical protein
MDPDAPKPKSAAALRALAEAAARRAEQERREAVLACARELEGRDGPEPVRYGDWERKGLASDF